MQVIGIIFFACLAFAIAILILITCCFYKVSSSKNDPKMCKTSIKTPEKTHPMTQITHNKSANDEKPSANVILFINKKNKYSDEKRNYQSPSGGPGRNHYQSTGDGLGIGHFNDGFCSQSGWGHHSNDQGFDDCGHTDVGGHGGDDGGGGGGDD